MSAAGGWCSERVRLLDEDPELGKWLTPDEVVIARERVMVGVLIARAGEWTPPTCENRSRHLGLLILDGVVARDQLLAGGVSTDLFGAGELLQPWTDGRGEQFVPRRVRWTIVERARLAVLGPSFLTCAGHWPALRNALLERAIQRCSLLSTQHAISQLPRVDMRLLALFWHLAERWGRAVRDGVVLPLPMSHTMLGHLAGAKRPTVSLSLQRLCSEGYVSRHSEGWLLHGEPSAALGRLERAHPRGDRPAVTKEPAALHLV
jgi:CRP/FNR family cyclic AMP-dependent transcriptional regulator